MAGLAGSRHVRGVARLLASIFFGAASALLRCEKSAAHMAQKRRVSACMTPRKVGRIASDVLFQSSQTEDLCQVRVVRRPSSRNKSPYVADAQLGDREVLVHVPSLDMGGKAGPGQTLVARLARTKSGDPVGADAKGKFGTPKCEYIAWLCRVDEAETRKLTGGPIWIGAHPTLGEHIAQSLVPTLFPENLHIESQVSIGDMRVDFVLTDGDGRKTLLEVKTVVDTDYDPTLPSELRGHLTNCFFGKAEDYTRAAIFPWGKAKQTTEDGIKCVSARAIKHLKSLAKAVETSEYNAAVLFVVVRHDVAFFRPNLDACPAFAKALRDASDKGVQVFARRVRWGDGERLGTAYDDGPLDVVLQS